MENLDPTLIEVVRRLTACFPGADPTVELIENYAAALSDLPLEDVAEACATLVKVWMPTYAAPIPPVAAIRDRAADAARERVQMRRGKIRALPQPQDREALKLVALSRKFRERTGRFPKREDLRQMELEDAGS